ncbi:MAG: DUF4867 family protein [Caldicoprobacterales bacterium]|jgi:hypothetical protein
MIEKIREANPTLHIHEISDQNFKKYGRILNNIDPSSMLCILESQTTMPNENNTYTPSFPELEQDPAAKVIQNKVFGGMEVQAGFCNGHGFKLNALEYHKCSEVNITSTGVVLFLGRAEDITQNQIQTSKIAAFYLPANIIIELFPLTLHYAPCKTHRSGFRCIVILEKGTNLPLNKLKTETSDEDKLLTAQNKWMIAHPDFAIAIGNSAFAGILGDNPAVNEIE